MNEERRSTRRIAIDNANDTSDIKNLGHLFPESKLQNSVVFPFNLTPSSLALYTLISS